MPHVHAPGLVLRFDPRILAAEGASFIGLDSEPLSGQQYFLCIASDPKEALWVPLHTEAATGRIGIPLAARSGHARWTRSSAYYDRTQVFRIAHKAAYRASTAAHDESTPKAPNRVLAAEVPAASVFPVDGEFRPVAENLDYR